MTGNHTWAHTEAYMFVHNYDHRWSYRNMQMWTHMGINICKQLWKGRQILGVWQTYIHVSGMYTFSPKCETI